MTWAAHISRAKGAHVHGCTTFAKSKLGPYGAATWAHGPWRTAHVAQGSERAPNKRGDVDATARGIRRRESGCTRASGKQGLTRSKRTELALELRGDLPQVWALLGLSVVLRPSSAENNARRHVRQGREAAETLDQNVEKCTSTRTGSANIVLRQLLLRRARRRRHASGAQGVSGQRKGAAHAHCSLPPARKAPTPPSIGQRRTDRQRQKEEFVRAVCTQVPAAGPPRLPGRHKADLAHRLAFAQPLNRAPMPPDGTDRSTPTRCREHCYAP